MGAVASRLSPATAFAAHIAPDLKEAGERLHAKVSRDGIGPTAVRAGLGVGNQMKDDISSLNKRVRDMASNLGQTTGEIAEKINSSTIRKEPISSLAGLAANGLKRAGLYTPTADAAVSRGEPVK